jgi:hypothetical protein
LKDRITNKEKKKEIGILTPFFDVFVNHYFPLSKHSNSIDAINFTL